MSSRHLEYPCVQTLYLQIYFTCDKKVMVKIDTDDKGVDMTDLVKERRAYVIDKEGECGGLEGFQVISKVPDYPKIIPAE